jgi:hypothetical protein
MKSLRNFRRNGNYVMMFWVTCLPEFCFISVRLNKTTFSKFWFSLRWKREMYFVGSLDKAYFCHRIDCVRKLETLLKEQNK